MNRHQQMVKDFHRAMDQPAPDKMRSRMESDEIELRRRLIKEEMDEFYHAAYTSNLPEMIDAICDMLYVVYGAAVQLGVDIEPFFEEVHRANMRKTDGEVRVDGKRMKPPGWEGPDIEGLLERMRAIEEDG